MDTPSTTPGTPAPRTVLARTLRPGDRVGVEPFVCAHVYVVGPSWEPLEVWLEDTCGGLHTLPGDATVILESAAA